MKLLKNILKDFEIKTLTQGCVRFLAEGKAKTDLENIALELEENGYSLLQERIVGDGVFKTFYLSGSLVSLYYLECYRRITVVFDTLDSGVIPPLEHKEFKKETSPEFYMLSLSKSGTLFGAGLSFALKLSDGSFVIFDGGYAFNADSTYQFLVDNSLKGAKPIIAAWVISHGHEDHCECILEFAKKYSDKVHLEQIVANPSHEKPKIDRLEDLLTDKSIKELTEAFNCEFVRPHLGQTLHYRDLKLFIMYTPEERIGPIDWLNSMSLSLMAEIAGKKIFLPFDLEEPFFADVFGDELKCDILQVTHHGWSGGTKEEYDYMRPEIAFFPLGEPYLKDRILPDYKHAQNYYLLQMVKEYYADNGKHIKILLKS